MADTLVDVDRSNIVPFYQVPVAQKQTNMFTRQGSPCGFFEAQFYHCMEAFGTKLGRLYCDLEYRDLSECVTQDKQRMRMHAIRQERLKQFMRGERLEPFERHMKPGDFRPYYFQYDYPGEHQTNA